MFGSIVISRNPVREFRQQAAQRSEEYKRVLMLTGTLLCLSGVIALLLPSLAGIGINLLIAVLLILLGGAAVFSGFGAQHAASRWPAIILGAVAALLGLFMLIQPLEGTVVLAGLLCAYFIADGLFGIMIAAQSRGTRLSWALGASAGLSLLLGLIILGILPEAAAWVLGVMLGVHLLADGVLSFVLAGRIRPVVEQDTVS